MKKVFTIILTAILSLYGTGAYAQMVQGEYRMTAGGGFTMFSLTGSDKGLVMDEVIPGFYFGADIDYAFSTIEGLSVETGAYIMHYGKAFSFNKGEAKSYHANYIRIPVNLKYEIPMETDGFALAAFTGPRFNLGLAGNMFSTGLTYMGLRGPDAQWGFGLSAIIQDAIVLRAGYDLGITKCIKDSKALGYNDINVMRNTLYFGVGFAF
ncbi:MAG: outer membrane beta-barrel protein [Bacteroidales bacterium]|nr:outer membrane beta-barrel protein [Bacteroidales bacterium]